MNLSTFTKGVCVGMVAGVMLDMATTPRPKTRKTSIGKIMQNVGNAMDRTLTDMRHIMH